MTTFKMKSYEGTDPDDGSPTFMVGLHDFDNDKLVACLAFHATDATRELVDNLELFKMGNAIGYYKLGDPQPVAHTFLADPNTVLVSETTVDAERVHNH